MSGTQHKRKQQTIIIVDDDPGNAQLLETLLQEEANYRTLAYPSGEMALEHINEIKQSCPVLLVADFMLARMNGLLLSESIHSIEELKTLPMILVTGSAREAVIQEIEQRGIPVLRKPYDIEQLLGLVEHQIAHAEHAS